MTAEMDIPLHVLEKITKNFSVDLRIGRGGYGDVYKGVLCDHELIAVKLLHDSVEKLDDELFKNEVGNLLTVEHPNIVQFLGYCYETRSKYVKYNGQNRFSKHIRRVLCFEYLQVGSLDKRLHEQSLAPTWSIHYNIIKGVCEGLNFLHGREPQILHLDLKPANILLDSNMTPKVADFGLSRLFGGSHTHVTRKMIGTEKYMSPDSINECIISPKNDIFSLGVVIIEIMAGPTGYSDFQEDVPKFRHEVLNKWSNIIEPTMNYRQQLLLQVKTCIDTAIRCVDPQRENRPTIASILYILNEIEIDIPNTQLAVMPPSRTIDIKNSLAETLKKMTANPDNITNLVANMEQVPNIRESSSNVEERFIIEKTEDRETSSYVEEGLIIGRTEERKKILSILSESSTREMVILPIYGIGGIGKTTLAQLVFNDTQFSCYSRVWVYVSEQLDLYKIGNCIISQLSKEISNIANMQIIHNRLEDLFADKRILIVLDDMWEKDAEKLDKLKHMLSLGKGSKVILVTTRDEAIAKVICNTVKNVKYKLEILTDDKCWAIIKQKSDFENQADKLFLEQIGRNIAIKCGGVALAAQSLGYMLRYMTSDQWESVRDSDIWNLSTSEDPSLTTHKVLASLWLSYSHMHKFLKLCFSYCALFPKGHIIAKYDLIHQWIALEFAKPSGIFDSMQLCEGYVMQLLGMSFLQYSVGPWGEVRPDKYAKFFTMHDLVHDLARTILADKVHNNGSAVGSICQYALLRDPSKPLQSFLSFPKNLRALHYLDCGKIELRDGAISAAEWLVVLDLSGCFVHKLPDSIGQLEQLRYLHAPRIQDCMTPKCISKLLKLNYLSLKGSHSIEALPDSICDMKGLMYLDLSGCKRILELPVFSKLKQLVYLDLSGCGSIRELPVSFAELKQLVHLDLSHCHITVPEGLGGFTKLQYLNLSLEYADAAKHAKRLPEVMGNLTNLRFLSLSKCMIFLAPLDADMYSLLLSISTLRNLEHLDLSSNGRLSSIPESITKLTKLHTLDLSGCRMMRKLPAWMAKMVSLKIVNVEPGRESPGWHFASLPKFKVLASPSEGRSNLFLLAPTNPHTLRISKLENVMSLEEVESIKLTEKQNMYDLTLKWSVDARQYWKRSIELDTRFVDDKDLLEKLVPPNTVRILYIEGYNSPSLPNWLMADIGLYLPNLCSINLEWSLKFNNLPPLGQLPNLKRLILLRLDSLEEWNTSYSSDADSANHELFFPKLEELHVEHCTRLRIKSCVPRALSSLRIDGSDNMLKSWGERVLRTSDSSSFSPLTKLDVRRTTVPLYHWKFLQHVSASTLRTLSIRDCSDLTSCSPESIQCLSSLESLDLEDDVLAELPTWLADLKSLKRLTLGLPKLEKLNDHARQLTRLESLHLVYCKRMTSLPQWLGELTSLKCLDISGSYRMRSLPGSIRHLESLDINNRELNIHLSRKMLSSISADTDEVDMHKFIAEYQKEEAEEDTARLKEALHFLRQQSADTLGESSSASTEPWELHMFKEIVAGGNFTEDQATTTGIILPGKTKKYWVDKNGSNCFMLFPRGMSIAWAENPKYYTWQPVEEGSDGGDVGIEVVELKDVCWLDIVGKQELSHLTPGVSYEVVFEAMLKRESCGWNEAADLWLKFPDGSDQNRKKSLHGMYGVERLQLKAGDVEAWEGMSGELLVCLSEHNDWWKSGLVIKCIRITPKFSSIQADTDEINMLEYIRKHLHREFLLEGESIEFTDSEEDIIESTDSEEDIIKFTDSEEDIDEHEEGIEEQDDREEHEEDIKNDATTADAHGDPGVNTAAVEGANLAALVRSPSAALSIESGSTAKNLLDLPADAVNTSTQDNVMHKRRVGAEGSAGPVIVEEPGQAEKRTRHLVPEAYAATTRNQDTASGSRININGTVTDALILFPAGVVDDAVAMDVEDLVPSLSALANEPDSAAWLKL